MKMRRVARCAAVTTLCVAGVIAAQSFRTATVKPSAGEGRPTVSFSRQGGLVTRNHTLRDLIQFAYHLHDFQISGGPAWITSDRFDITAQAAMPEGKIGPDFLETTIAPQLQAFLNRRFDLKLHREMKQHAVYSLTGAKDGSLLRRSRQACSLFEWGGETIPPDKRYSPGYCGAAETGPNIRLNHTLDAIGMSITGTPHDWGGLIAVLSRELDRIVVDKTGLTGAFDIQLEWNREATQRCANSGTCADPPGPDNESPSLFAAVEDQLGLKLVSDQAPVEILVIDRAEKPAEN